MRYAVIGIGPVGAILATHLRSAGHDVSVLDADPARRANLATGPMKISGALTAEARLEQVYGTMDEILFRDPEVFLICTKSSRSPEVLETLRGYYADAAPLVISCQNGIDVEDQISQVFGPGAGYRIVLNLACSYIGNTDVWVQFCFPSYLSDINDNPLLFRAYRDLSASGFPLLLSKSYKFEVLKKAILNTSLGSVCAMTGMTMSQVMRHPELVRMVREIIRESMVIGQAMGFVFGEDYMESALAYLSKGGDHKPSMLVDVENHQVTENEYHAGNLYRYAQKYGVDAPVIQTLYYLIKHLEKSNIEKASQTAPPTGVTP